MKNKTTFGNFKKPTPKWAKLLFSIFAAVSGTMSVIVVTFSEEIPDDTEKLLLKIAAVGVPLMKVFTESFGIDNVDNTTSR